jgi:hypothetical protein
MNTHVFGGASLVADAILDMTAPLSSGSTAFCLEMRSGRRWIDGSVGHSIRLNPNIVFGRPQCPQRLE